MKTIKLTLALLTFAICMGSCAMILGIDSNTLMKIQKGMTKERSHPYWDSRCTVASITKWKDGDMRKVFPELPV